MPVRSRCTPATDRLVVCTQVCQELSKAGGTAFTQRRQGMISMSSYGPTFFSIHEAVQKRQIRTLGRGRSGHGAFMAVRCEGIIWL